MKDRHNYVKTYEEAAAVGINAGMDQEGGGNAAEDVEDRGGDVRQDAREP